MAPPNGGHPADPGEGRSLRRGLVRQTRPRVGRFLVAIDGKPVQNVDELLTEVESHAPGEVVKVTVLRGGRTVEIPVTLGQS